MSIQWFPGHMHLTKKAIIERMKDTDVVIEMLDARLPGSSANPMLAELTKGKPGLKVLNKQDLADPVCTEQWLAYYTQVEGGNAGQDGDSGADTGAQAGRPNMLAISLDASDGVPGLRMVRACRALAPHRGTVVKPLRVLICGIPNVGKSTLINRLAGKRAAKTGDEAGVTKLEQRIALSADFYLYDTPGMLWPRIVAPQCGYNLAASGAVGRNAYEDEDVALALAATLKLRYVHLLQARFKLKDVTSLGDEALLDAIGRKRGALLNGGKINLQKAAEILIHEFRSASLGRITLETTEDFLAWQAEGEQADVERMLAKKNRKKA